ncbi:hypothetical protein Kisp02_19970 [Kineosporia sp. NBRC 101731]|nr:hypothetical protein Kisp02_19970 [Kineosporia sp. NBRC 101731]
MRPADGRARRRKLSWTWIPFGGTQPERKLPDKIDAVSGGARS